MPRFMCGPFDFNNTPHNGVGSSYPGTKLMTSLGSGSGFEIRCNQQRLKVFWRVIKHVRAVWLLFLD